MSLNKYMHPRNPYKYQKPDFQDLASKYPEFSAHTVQDTAGKVFLDFKDPEALRVLTKTLLKENFGLDVELPSDRLVPTIPLRLNYLLWIEDIVGKKKKGVKGIDIGTGSSCIYPFLGHKTNKWTFLATDVDAQNVFYAKKNVEKNDLSSAIKVKKVTEDALITGALLDEDSEMNYDFCMCNPPFFADHMEAQAISTSRSPDRPEPTSVSTASPKESIAMGGEVAFVKHLITDSVALRKRVRVYTTMIGKKTSLPPLKEELRKIQVPKYATTEFCQGKTMRWGIAWTFDETVVFPKSPFQSSKNEKPPLTYTVPFGAGGVLYDILSLTEHIKTLLGELKVEYKVKKCHKGFSSLSAKAFEDTWSNQRRKRRQKMREQKLEEGGDNSGIAEADKGDNSVKDDSGVADITEHIEMETKEIMNEEKATTSTECQVENSEVKVSETEEVKMPGENDACDKESDMKCDTTENGSGDRKRKNDSDECGESKKVKMSETDTADADEGADVKCSQTESKVEKKPGQGKMKRYIMKWEINLKKPMGVRDITLDMIWRDGERRESMHQVMQFFKNRLKSPC